jgi:hypothetical protein
MTGDISRLSCREAGELAPDVALGLLTGEARAAALAHFERCEACRAELASLAVTADEVLLAAPEATPPAGFADAVVSRIESERAAGGGLPPVPAAMATRPLHLRSHRSRRRRVSLVAMAAAAVAVVVAGIVAVTGSGGPSSVSTATAEIRTGRGDVVGEATVSGGDTATVVLDVPDWARLVELWADDAPAGGYWLAVEEDDGTRTLRAMPQAVEHWSVPIHAAARDVAAVSMIDADGRVWCSGRFERST